MNTQEPPAYVSVQSVSKRYGEQQALSNVSFELRSQRVALLGPNGAGKSTLIKSILGLHAIDSGTITALGRDVARDPLGVRARIGYMPEGDHVLAHLAALEFVTLAAELSGLPKNEARGRAHLVLGHVGLGEARYRKLGGFSTGMKQRARLAQALVGDPKLLLLDEPTSGLDPRGREEMLALIAEIPERTGAAVILSTHILPDVERTCDYVVLMGNGDVRYSGPLHKLVHQSTDVYETRVKGDATAFHTALVERGFDVQSVNGALEVRVKDGMSAKDIMAVGLEVGAQVRHCAPLLANLERAFTEKLANPSE